jgi:hypothetical protein
MIAMLSLRLFRPFVRRSNRALRRPAPCRPRLSFECLETRDMLAATIGPAALPFGPLVAHNGASNPSPRVDNPAGTAAVSAIAFAADHDDHGPMFVSAVYEVRVVVVVVVFEVPTPTLLRAFDIGLHESDRSALAAQDIAPDRIPTEPTVTAPTSGPDHAVLGTADSTAPAMIHPGTAVNAIGVPPAGNITVPLNLPQVAAGMLTTPPAGLERLALTAQFLANVQPPRPTGQPLVTVGVPGPTEVTAAASAYAPAAESSNIPAPTVAPWLAGLLTPVMQFDPAEPLQTIEHIISAVPEWGPPLARSLASLITSPWMACAAVAVAAVELVRRRARRAPQREDDALDVPTITGPSQLS